MPSLTNLSTSSSLLSRVQSLERKIGRTPLHEVTKVFNKSGVSIHAKKEWMQLSGSVKARAGYRIIRKAIETGLLGEGKILLDATSGNTGIAYASIAKLLGIPVRLCLPENASSERIRILTGSGGRFSADFKV